MPSPILLIFALLNINFTALAQADQCEPRKAYDKLAGLALNNELSGVNDYLNNGQDLGPTRDQDSVGWCYAFAAADLTQQWLQKNPKVNFPQSQHLSPVPFAINNERTEGEILAYNASLHRHLLQSAEHEEALNEINIRLDELKLRKEELEKNSIVSNELAGLNQGIQYYALLKKSMHQSVGGIDNVPGAGYSAVSIYSPGKRLCFESEINSRDEALSQAASSYQNIMMDSNLLTSNTSSIQIREVFEGLSYLSFSKDQTVRCDFDNLIRQVIPKSTGEDLNSLWSAIEEMQPYEDIFDEIVDRACEDKVPLEDALNDLNLEIQRQSQNIPMEDNSKLFAQIDTTLANGHIASVSYRSSIFDTNDLQNNVNDFHESVIIGSLNICGNKHYILRNSWGEQSCQTKRAQFQAPADEQTLIDQNYASCEQQAREIIESKYGDYKCQQLRSPMSNDEQSINACFSDRIELRSQCSSQANSQRQKLAPFTCDDRGNFIVTKEQLAKGLYGVTSPKVDTDG